MTSCITVLRSNGTWSRRALGPVYRALLVTLLVTSTAGAQAPDRRRPPQAPPVPPQPADARAALARPVIEADLASVDDELAAHLLARGDAAADAAARLDLLIDLRVVARWLLAAAAAERADTDLQVAAVLRADELLATARTLQEQFKSAPKSTPGQLDAMGKLHALTFKLPELKQVKQADEVCREVGGWLVGAAGPLPPEVRQIPLMRPPPATRPPPAVAATPGQPPRPPLPPRVPPGDPLARASALAVSAPLKKQVVNLLTLGVSGQAEARGDGKRLADAAAVAATANRALDLAEGLAANTAVDPAARPRLEQQLADGLALYADPRTRPIGQQRLAALDDYARRLGRIRRLNLPPDLQQRLAPAFAWAGNRPDQAGKLLETIERYLAECNRMDARAAATQPALPQREAKAVADAVKLAAREREDFLADAATLGTPAQRVDVSALGLRVDTLRGALDAIDTYERVPRAVQALLLYKPRPTGGLDRRVAALVAAVLDPRPSPLKDEAAKALPELVGLADLAAELDAMPDVPPDVQQLYARGKLAAFDAKRREVVADLASQIAAGRTLDPALLDRLKQMRTLRAALVVAAGFEQALKRGDVLARWVDWPVEPAELQAIVTPYRDTLAALVEAYAADLTPAVDWAAVEARYGPLVRLVARQSAYADACAAMPAGLAGHVGRLMTPVEGQPFAAERRAAVALKLWARYEQTGDAKSVAAVAEALGRQVEWR